MFLKNISAFTLYPASVFRTNLRINDGEICEEGSTLRPRRDEETVDLDGKFVLPGLVNSHTHLYSSLSRGMPAPSSAPKNFVEILKKIWWRLDESLDAESIYYSALAGAIEAVQNGTTTIIDHHASPNCIHGSLDLIKKALSTVGVRGILCYETTDRGGKQRRQEALEENERFLVENVHDSHFKGLIGAHASFTLEDETLKSLGELAKMYDSGVHIHLAEDAADVIDASKRRRTDIVARLKRYGVLTEQSILAHGVHLNEKQLQAIGQCGSWLVHNPRSNMNNAVGYAPIHLFGDKSALGTDGFPSDMFEEAKIGYFRNAESAKRRGLFGLPRMLQTGNNIVSGMFGRKFGSLRKGNAADLVVLDYLPPTPFHAKNIAGHFLFGMQSSAVENVMIDGRWIVWNKQFVGLDVQTIVHETRNVAKRLWKKL